MHSGSHIQVEQFVSRHSSYVTFDLIPEEVIDKFADTYPDVGTDWVPAIAIEEVDREDAEQAKHAYIHRVEPNPDIRIEQMYQNFIGIRLSLQHCFEANYPDRKPFKYYYHLMDVKHYVEAVLQLSFIEGHHQLWQMKLGDRWIVYPPETDPDTPVLLANREENARRMPAYMRWRANYFAGTPPEFPGGLFRRDGVTTAVADQRRTVHPMPKAKAKANANAKAHADN